MGKIRKNMWRKRAHQKAYHEYITSRPHPCDLCYDETIKRQYISESNHMWVLKTAYPYDTWDLQKVEDHFMIVPKRHTESISHFTKEEGEEYFSIMAEYEGKGYSIYSRAMTNKAKSIPHVHTHLFKLSKDTHSVYIYLGKLNLMMFK